MNERENKTAKPLRRLRVKLEMQGDIVINLPTTETLGCDLNDCCPKQLLSWWKVGGKDKHHRFRGEGVGEGE